MCVHIWFCVTALYAQACEANTSANTEQFHDKRPYVTLSQAQAHPSPSLSLTTTDLHSTMLSFQMLCRDHRVLRSTPWFLELTFMLTLFSVSWNLHSWQRELQLVQPPAVKVPFCTWNPKVSSSALWLSDHSCLVSPLSLLRTNSCTLKTPFEHFGPLCYNRTTDCFWV